MIFFQKGYHTKFTTLFPVLDQCFVEDKPFNMVLKVIICRHINFTTLCQTFHCISPHFTYRYEKLWFLTELSILALFASVFTWQSAQCKLLWSPSVYHYYSSSKRGHWCSIDRNHLKKVLPTCLLKYYLSNGS